MEQDTLPSAQRPLCLGLMMPDILEHFGIEVQLHERYSLKQLHDPREGTNHIKINYVALNQKLH